MLDRTGRRYQVNRSPFGSLLGSTYVTVLGANRLVLKISLFEFVGSHKSAFSHDSLYSADIGTAGAGSHERLLSRHL